MYSSLLIYLWSDIEMSTFIGLIETIQQINHFSMPMNEIVSGRRAASWIDKIKWCLDHIHTSFKMNCDIGSRHPHHRWNFNKFFVFHWNSLWISAFQMSKSIGFLSFVRFVFVLCLTDLMLSMWFWHTRNGSMLRFKIDLEWK